nr:Retrovirus-related Pol polyprotein from transposon RE1 [Ipomoea batatas]
MAETRSQTSQNQQEVNLQATAPTRIDATDLTSPYYLHSGESPSLVLVSTLLDGGNYQAWSRTVKMALVSKNKLGFVDGTIKAPNKDEAHYTEHHRMEQVTTFLRGLNECYSSVKSQIMLMTPLPMIGKACAFVQQQEREVMRTSQSEATGQSAFLARGWKSRNDKRLGSTNEQKSVAAMVTGTSGQHSFVANSPLESGFIDSSGEPQLKASEPQPKANALVASFKPLAVDGKKPINYRSPGWIIDTDNSPTVSCDGQAADDLDYISSGYNVLANGNQEVSSHADPSSQNAFTSPTQSVSSMHLDPQTNQEQSPGQNDVGSQLNCLPSQEKSSGQHALNSQMDSQISQEQLLPVIPVLRRSNRHRVPPSYLKDYHCSLLKNPPSSSCVQMTGSPHELSRVIGYDVAKFIYDFLAPSLFNLSQPSLGGVQLTNHRQVSSVTLLLMSTVLLMILKVYD